MIARGVTHDGDLQGAVLLVLHGAQDVQRVSLDDALQGSQLPQELADALHRHSLGQADEEDEIDVPLTFSGFRDNVAGSTPDNFGIYLLKAYTSVGGLLIKRR